MKYKEGDVIETHFDDPSINAEFLILQINIEDKLYYVKAIKPNHTVYCSWVKEDELDFYHFKRHEDEI